MFHLMVIHLKHDVLFNELKTFLKNNVEGDIEGYNLLKLIQE